MTYAELKKIAVRVPGATTRYTSQYEFSANFGGEYNSKGEVSLRKGYLNRKGGWFIGGEPSQEPTKAEVIAFARRAVAERATELADCADRAEEEIAAIRRRQAEYRAKAAQIRAWLESA